MRIWLFGYTLLLVLVLVLVAAIGLALIIAFDVDAWLLDTEAEGEDLEADEAQGDSEVEASIHPQSPPPQDRKAKVKQPKRVALRAMEATATDPLPPLSRMPPLPQQALPKLLRQRQQLPWRAQVVLAAPRRMPRWRVARLTRVGFQDEGVEEVWVDQRADSLPRKAQGHTPLLPLH